MKKWIMMLCLAVGMSMIISACGGSNSDGGSSGGSDSGASASTGETKSFTIKATNWAFEPTEIRVSKGDTVEIKLVNEEGYHEVEIKGYGKTIKGDRDDHVHGRQNGRIRIHLFHLLRHRPRRHDRQADCRIKLNRKFHPMTGGCIPCGMCPSV